MGTFRARRGGVRGGLLVGGDPVVVGRYKERRLSRSVMCVARRRAASVCMDRQRTARLVTPSAESLRPVIYSNA